MNGQPLSSDVRLELGILCVAMLVAMACLAGCAGSGNSPVDVEQAAFDDLRAKVRDVIDDPERRSSALAIVDRLAVDLGRLRESIALRKQRMRVLNANYGSSRSEFVALLDGIKHEIRANKQRVSEQHRALRALTTPAEWSKIAHASSRAMEAVAASIQAI